MGSVPALGVDWDKGDPVSEIASQLPPAAATVPAPPVPAANEPVRFDHYTLALTWTPTFCLTLPDKTKCMPRDPGRFEARNLVLHGLWPSREDDPRHTYAYCGVDEETRGLDKFPTWCRLGPLELSEATWEDMRVVMPGSSNCLERHEWYKHGVCSGLGADAYYAASLALAREINATRFGRRISESIGETVEVSDLLAAFEEDFGPGSRRSVVLLCKKDTDKLLEVLIYLKKSLPSDGPRADRLYQPQAPALGTCPGAVRIEPASL